MDPWKTGSRKHHMSPTGQHLWDAYLTSKHHFLHNPLHGPHHADAALADWSIFPLSTKWHWCASWWSQQMSEWQCWLAACTIPTMLTSTTPPSISQSISYQDRLWPWNGRPKPRTFVQSIRSWARCHRDRSQGEILCPCTNLPPRQAWPCRNRNDTSSSCRLLQAHQQCPSLLMRSPMTSPSQTEKPTEKPTQNHIVQNYITYTNSKKAKWLSLLHHLHTQTTTLPNPIIKPLYWWMKTCISLPSHPLSSCNPWNARLYW